MWTWEVPLYFWFGGIAAGSSFVALACDLAGDERSAAVARKVALGALGPVAGAADPRPRAAGAVREHAADLQAALADVDGRVGADAVRQPRGGRGRRRPARARAAWRARSARANAVVGGYLGSYTGVLLASTAVPVWARSRLFLGPIFVSHRRRHRRRRLPARARRRRAAGRAPDAARARHGRDRRDGAPSWCSRSSTSGGSGELASGARGGAAGQALQGSPSGRCAPGSRCASARERGGPWVHHARERALPRGRAGVPLRLGRRRAPSARARRGRGADGAARSRSGSLGDRRQRAAGRRRRRRAAAARSSVQRPDSARWSASARTSSSAATTWSSGPLAKISVSAASRMRSCSAASSLAGPRSSSVLTMRP